MPARVIAERSSNARPRAILASRVAGAAIAVGSISFLAASDPTSFAHGLLLALARAVFWGAVLLVAARLGAWISGSRLVGVAHLAWDGAVGLAVLAGVLLGIGLVPGGFTQVSIASTLTLAAAVALWRASRDPVARFARAPAADGSRWILPSILAVVGAGMVWNRVPALFFDSLAYHYAQPGLWLVEGRIAPEPWSLHSWFPPGMSVLFGVGLSLGGETWANDANLLVGVVLLLTGFDFARRLWGPMAGLSAVGCLMALCQIPYALAIPAADLAHGTFTATALAALFLARGAERPEWVQRAAWLAAGAVLTKYLGLLVPLGIGILWVSVRAAGRSRLGSRAGAALRFSAPALLLVGPWLAMNAATVGNPVAPMLAGVLETRGLAPGGAEAFRIDARSGLPGPDDVKILGKVLVSGRDEGTSLYPSPIWGWAAAALLPVVLLAWREDRDVRRVLALAAILFAFWFASFRVERFLVATTFLMAVAAAGAIACVWRRGGVARGLPLAAAVVGVLSLVQAGQRIESYAGGVAVALGREAPGALTERSIPVMRLFREAGEVLDAGSNRVLLVGEMRHFRLDVPHAAPTGFNTHPLAAALERSPDPTEARRDLRELGFTHVIVDAGWVRRSAAHYPSLSAFRDRPELLGGFVRSLGRPLAAGPNMVLLEIPRVSDRPDDRRSKSESR